MNKSELIENLVAKNHTVSAKAVENAVKEILDQVSSSLENSDRIEIRGFGSFSLHFRQPRIGRNPKTGTQVKLEAKAVPHFKAGKELRERVDVHS
ncbi:integration host factor subunit beta [Cricetibacter osteomyelitidis]|uniref:Integration host factor subunit beta n=1 Tax=Cricetibacter osteomyelitidis TaxID=1521931 RepID=A0A4R2SMF9_9PAST|nr:integration host factor subunit beta [Cricetibacter osteomyelitidis]TCP91207.1 integration host factor subunit beta [Cricetibacter osteomyelitidis]